MNKAINNEFLATLKGENCVTIRTTFSIYPNSSFRLYVIQQEMIFLINSQ